MTTPLVLRVPVRAAVVPVPWMAAIDGSVALMSTSNVVVATSSAPSVTVAMTVNSPDSVGVPETVPDSETSMPSGSPAISQV